METFCLMILRNPQLMCAFGDTFPLEGNRNASYLPNCSKHSLSLDTLFRWKGIETSNSSSVFALLSSLWRHFPARRESKPHSWGMKKILNSFRDTFPVAGNRNYIKRLDFTSKMWYLWRHFPGRRESKRINVQLYGVLPAIFGDTFPLEGNRNANMSPKS